MTKLDRETEILGADPLNDPIDAAWHAAIRIDFVRELVDLAERGAFSTLLDPDVEEQLWG